MKRLLPFCFIYFLLISCITQEPNLYVWDEKIPEDNIATLISRWNNNTAVGRIYFHSYNGIQVKWVFENYSDIIIKIPSGKTELICDGIAGWGKALNLPFEYNFLPGVTYIFDFKWGKKTGNETQIAIIILLDENKKEIYRKEYEVKFNN